MNRDQSLTILMPAYNEEARIGRTLEAYLDHFRRERFPGIEVLVIANGCRDNTVPVVREFMARFPHLKCIVEPRAVGKGGAIMRGFRQASGDVIGYVDADNSTLPGAFEKLVDALDDTAEVAIGSRWLPGAVVSPKQPLKRRIVSRVFNILVRLFFGVQVTDTQCGAKVFRKVAVKSILPSLGITRWAFDVDILFQCRRHGFRIKEVPTVWSDSAGSRLRIVAASVEMLMAIVRLRLMYSPFRFVVTIWDYSIGLLFRPKQP